MASRIRIFQINSDVSARTAPDPEFEPLDHGADAGPHWAEYWPIWRYLNDNPLAEDCHYGFLPPRFRADTGLTGRDVKAFVAQAAAHDVVGFPPFPDQASLYINMFEQGESRHQGMADTARALFDAIGLRIDITRLVMDSRTTIHCNYLVAKPVFWKRWKQVVDQCLAHVQDPSSRLYAPLNAPVAGAQMHTPVWALIAERLASTLLAGLRDLSVRNYPPFRMPASNPYCAQFGKELVALDAAKRAYLDTRDEAYLQCFRTLQQQTLQSLQRLTRRGLARADKAVDQGPPAQIPTLAGLFAPQTAQLSIPTSDSACNPSVVWSAGRLMVLVRSHNYRLNSRGEFVGVNGQELHSENWLLEVDDGLRTVAQPTLIDDRLVLSAGGGRLAPNGLEDCRLHLSPAGLFVLGSGRFAALERNTMVRASIVDGRFCDVRAIRSPFGHGREKNWMVVEGSHGALVIYRMSPFCLIRLGDGATNIEATRMGHPSLADYSGSSQVVLYGGSYLCIVHARIEKPGGTYYVHRIVEMDPAWNVAGMSDEFFFEHRGVEFCSGMAILDREVIFSYGINDSAAKLMRLTKDQVDSLIKRAPSGDDRVRAAPGRQPAADADA
ncbi:MAG: hypothetical protein P4L83_01655 [Nevskia sp.]|nr:hypothetical protein [Nevskia sp.]